MLITKNFPKILILMTTLENGSLREKKDKKKNVKETISIPYQWRKFPFTF